MPEETPEQIAAREAAEAQTQTDDAAEEARTAAETARQEAETARAAAEAEKTAAATERAQLAQERAAEAERKANEAEAAKTADGKKQYGEDYVSRLRAEAAGHRVKAKEYQDALTEAENQRKSDVQRLEEQAAGAETRATTAEAKLERIEVAIAAKLPLHLAARLVGDSREALEADAKELLKSLKPATGQSLDGGQRGAGAATQQNQEAQDKPTDMNRWLRRTAGISA